MSSVSTVSGGEGGKEAGGVREVDTPPFFFAFRGKWQPGRHRRACEVPGRELRVPCARSPRLHGGSRCPGFSLSTLATRGNETRVKCVALSRAPFFTFKTKNTRPKAKDTRNRKIGRIRRFLGTTRSGSRQGPERGDLHEPGWRKDDERVVFIGRSKKYKVTSSKKSFATGTRERFVESPRV